MKCSHSTGFDPVVSDCPTICCLRQLLVRQQQIAEGYIATIRWCRRQYKSMTNKRGPGYYAVTLCEYEDEPGLTSSSTAKGRRWACNTCFNFAPPIWTDNTTKCPTTEDALIEYGQWLAKGTNAKKPWRKDMMNHDVK